MGSKKNPDKEQPQQAPLASRCFDLLPLLWYVVRAGRKYAQKR